MSRARQTTSRTKGLAIPSRPTSAAIGGKFDVVVKTLLDDDTADALRVFARNNGYGSVSDCLRELVMVTVFGEEFLVSLHEARISALSKNVARKRSA